MGTIQTLLDRDSAADASRLSERLEDYRDREQQIGPRPIEREAEQPAWPGDAPVPEVHVDAFNNETLLSAIASRGCLIVRGFFDPAIANLYIPIIDQMLDTVYTDSAGGDEAALRRALNNPPEAISSLLTEQVWKRSRGFHRLSGSVMCVESASIAEQMIELYESRGLKQIVGDYLGERPCLSALKWVLRRSLLPVNEAGWHQDGAFMGKEINSLNMWVSLSRCGGDTGAPGMDILPVRLQDIVGAGDDDAVFDWGVGKEAVASKYGPDAIVSPVFEVGDAFFFDHFLLHRTQYREHFPRLRYAIETWFFGADNFPKNQVPLAW